MAEKWTGSVHVCVWVGMNVGVNLGTWWPWIYCHMAKSISLLLSVKILCFLDQRNLKSSSPLLRNQECRREHMEDADDSSKFWISPQMHSFHLCLFLRFTSRMSWSREQTGLEDKQGSLHFPQLYPFLGSQTPPPRPPILRNGKVE